MYHYRRNVCTLRLKFPSRNLYYNQTRKHEVKCVYKYIYYKTFYNSFQNERQCNAHRQTNGYINYETSPHYNTR